MEDYMKITLRYCVSQIDLLSCIKSYTTVDLFFKYVNEKLNYNDKSNSEIRGFNTVSIRHSFTEQLDLLSAEIITFLCGLFSLLGERNIPLLF